MRTEITAASRATGQVAFAQNAATIEPGQLLAARGIDAAAQKGRGLMEAEERARRSGEVDEALAQRDTATALRLMEQMLAEAADGFGLDEWRKIGAIRRAAGDLRGALAAVRQALVFAPLDFFSLLAKASLQEQLGDPDCGETFGRALAQRPAGDMPPALQGAVAHAEQAYAAHQARVETNLLAGASPVLGGLDDAARLRTERFVSNISRRTRAWHSTPTHFHYPALRENEFHERHLFPWLEAWEALTDVIAEEYAAVLRAETADLQPYLTYGEDEPLAQWRALNRSRDWTAIHLLQRGQVIEANARHCPRTMAFLQNVPQPAIPGCGANAMFSLLAPDTRIPPHVGVANFRLVAHLPLIVPRDCWFRVGGTTREWKRGEAFVFDDTIEHEAANDSDELRVVMIIDCWHPDIAPAERAAITEIIARSPNAGVGL